ncbi:MAG: hypothetical protein FWC46_02065 [Actinomycetia bacterium]|nr:hypothetical protein [Actinomycetes bacterium]
MALITVDTGALRHDAIQFQDWSTALDQLWSSLGEQLALTSDDCGTVGHLPEFYDQFTGALADLSNFLTGNDSSADPGGRGALACFMRVLVRTASIYDRADEQAAQILARLR